MDHSLPSTAPSKFKFLYQTPDPISTLAWPFPTRETLHQVPNIRRTLKRNDTTCIYLLTLPYEFPSDFLWRMACTLPETPRTEGPPRPRHLHPGTVDEPREANGSARGGGGRPEGPWPVEEAFEPMERWLLGGDTKVNEQKGKSLFACQIRTRRMMRA